MDGHPRLAIAPGQRYAYEFTVSNRAGRYWFHPHAHGQTGAQVYFGLAGLFLVGDDEEAALRLPSGRYDVPLVLQDRTFNDDNQFIYLESGLRDGAATDNPDRSPMMGARSDGRWYGWWDTGPRDDAGGMGSMMPRMMCSATRFSSTADPKRAYVSNVDPSACDCSTAPIAQLQACLARWLAARRNRWVTV